MYKNKITPMYKTDGSVHHCGVKNEENTIKILNELGIYNFDVTKKGGTTQKADAISGSKSLSIKRKKGITNGSFDWFNTSKYNDVLGDSFSEFVSKMKEFRTLSKGVISDKQFISKVRNEFNSLCKSSLDNLTSNQIIEILTQGFVESNCDFDIIVNDVKDQKLYIFPIESHPAVKYLNEGFTAFLDGKGKSSRKVLFSDGVNLHDCGLRIRVTNNNGISAFLGLSKANNNSQVVIKLQQDKVKQLLISTKAKEYDY